VHFFLGHYFQLLVSVYCAKTAFCTMHLCIALRHIKFLSLKKNVTNCIVERLLWRGFIKKIS
jgi:hypothetical protein